MRRLHPKIIAILLLLVFSQKLGLRLWLHHWIHEAQTLVIPGDSSSGNIQFQCDCFDDAMMPLMESAVITLPVPIRTWTILAAGYHPPFSAAEKLFYSLKGPPAFPL